MQWKHYANVQAEWAQTLKILLGVFFRLPGTRIFNLDFPPLNAKVSYPCSSSTVSCLLVLSPHHILKEEVLGRHEEFEAPGHPSSWWWWWQHRHTMSNAVSKFLCFCKDKRYILYSLKGICFTKGTITTIAPQDNFSHVYFACSHRTNCIFLIQFGFFGFVVFVLHVLNEKLGSGNMFFLMHCL